MATNLMDQLEPSLERELYTVHDRYLQPLCDAALDERYLSLRSHLRLAEIAANADLPCWDLPLNNWNGPRYWLRKELLTTEEFRLRGRALPAAPPPSRSPFDPTRPPSLVGKRRGGEAFLVRFDQAKHLRNMHERGEVRLSPAASLFAEQHNAARRDDELRKHRYTRGEHLRATDPRTGQPIPILDSARFTSQTANYYFLCLSNEFDADLFTAFNVDACLIIHDPVAFADRLEGASQQRLAGWHFNHVNVEYYDAYEAAPGELLHAVISKTIDFAYEQEYRFFWAPPKGKPSADKHLLLDLGPLQDITEIYEPARRP